MGSAGQFFLTTKLDDGHRREVELVIERTLNAQEYEDTILKHAIPH